MYKPEDIHLNNIPTSEAQRKLFWWISKASTLCYIVYDVPHELSARSNLSFDQRTISKS